MMTALLSRPVRKNDTHQSTTDPEAKLYRKANGREAKLSDRVMRSWRTGLSLAVGGMVTPANGTAERRASRKSCSETSQRLKAHHRRRGQGLRHQRSHCRVAPDERHAACCAATIAAHSRPASAAAVRSMRAPPATSVTRSYPPETAERIFGGKQHGTMRKTKPCRDIDLHRRVTALDRICVPQPQAPRRLQEWGSSVLRQTTARRRRRNHALIALNQISRI